MISRRQWLSLERGDLLKRGSLVRRVEKTSMAKRKWNSEFECRYVVLRKIRPSWTDPNPWTTYLFTDLRWTHSVVRRKHG